MKLVEFNYTKSDGKTSQRAVIELQQPSTHFEGIDVSDLPEAEFALFVQEYRQLKQAQYDATLQLLQQHDLTHNYRRFVPERMTNTTTEHI